MADKYTRWVYTPKFYLSCCDALFGNRLPTPSGQNRPKLRKGFPLPLQEKIDECCCCILKPHTTKRGREIKGSLCPLSWSDPKNYGTTHNLSDAIVFWADQMAVSTLQWVSEAIPKYKKRLQRYGRDILKLDRCKNGFSAIRNISTQLNVIGQLIADNPIDDQLSLRPKLPPRLPPILPTSKSGMRFFPLSHSLLNAAKNNLFSTYGLSLLRKTLKRGKSKGLVYVLTDGVGARLVMGPKTSDIYKTSLSSLISSPTPKQTTSLDSSPTPVSVQAASTLCLGVDPGRAVIADTALVLKDEAGGPESDEMAEFSVIPKGHGSTGGPINIVLPHGTYHIVAVDELLFKAVKYFNESGVTDVYPPEESLLLNAESIPGTISSIHCARCHIPIYPFRSRTPNAWHCQETCFHYLRLQVIDLGLDRCCIQYPLFLFPSCGCLFVGPSLPPSQIDQPSTFPHHLHTCATMFEGSLSPEAVFEPEFTPQFEPPKPPLFHYEPSPVPSMPPYPHTDNLLLNEIIHSVMSRQIPMSTYERYYSAAKAEDMTLPSVYKIKQLLLEIEKRSHTVSHKGELLPALLSC
ncbi:hypothetical protein ADUPG1_009618 [Aduncisulcus paluster]|uniref:Uncharacterized protein n=1 Tax=Aduncisulcus paluster TaxID=2918883 RepID=A0ABQ5KXD7_9EUKA|nr:hypothetical protein ADUPG1_009618 [Aduncisulcus paluster]